ncbi:MAG: hypothetical protein V8S71_05530 [Oscillospiraceae bacterium]
MANPRNAAAGSLRQLDPKIAAQRRLDCVIFNIQLTDRVHSRPMQQLDYFQKSSASWSFPALCCPTLLRCRRRFTGWDGSATISFEMDGAVVKVNALEPACSADTAKFPRWAVAWKYPPEQKPARYWTSWCRWDVPAS